MADRLHIAIDGRELVGRPTGVGRYTLELVRRWTSRTPHRYTIVVPAAPSPALREIGGSAQWVVLPDAVAGTWWEQLKLPRALRREQPDVLFAPAYTAPLSSPCPFVVVVHDLSYYAHPEWFGWREGLRRRWVTRAAARRAGTVVTVSEFSKDEIRRFLDVPAGRILVAPQGPPSVEAPPPGGRDRLVLYVGSLFNRRHVPEMIAGFAGIATATDARLVLVGDNRTRPHLDPRAIAAGLGVADRVEWREYAGDAERDALYRTARAFLFLSDYEGFAMTPLEAIAHGVPAVLQDTPVSREIYGDGAIRVAPDLAAIGAALSRLLTDDAAHAAQAAAGRARLAAFSWDRSADAVMQALEGAAR